MSLPIHHLSEIISKNFSALHSLNIPEEIAKGLNPQIRYIEGLTTIAEISETGRVEISSNYCQMLWLICNIALRIHDSASVSASLAQMNDIEKRTFMQGLKKNCSESEYLRQVFDWEGNIKICSELSNLIKGILNSSTSADSIYKNKYASDLESPLAQRVNSLYCYGINFILLHEYSHHALGHDLSSEGNTQEEKDADANAFWTLCCDLKEKEKTTAMMGVICALSSLLFLNPSLKNDGIHPQENERLFNFYDIIVEESQKDSYLQMLVMLLTTWAICCNITDFPKVGENGATKVCLNQMREYLSNLAGQAGTEFSC